jgi:hypothetical protein
MRTASREAKSLAAELLEESLVLDLQVLDDLFLPIRSAGTGGIVSGEAS